jgi:predicted nicotinamide N-methyase
MDQPPPPPPVPVLKVAPVASDLPVSAAPRKVSKLVEKKLATLSWRDGRGNQENYSLEVDGVVLNMAQRKLGELTGLGTGGNVWNAVIVFSKWLEKNYGAGKHQDLWKGKTILELGSGTGMGGIACAQIMKGASHIVLTDQAQVLSIIEENVNRNKATIPELEKVSVREFEWGSDIKLFNDPVSPPFDWIIACDCIAPIFPLHLLLQSLMELSNENTTIIVGSEQRQFTQAFWDGAREAFDISIVPEQEMDPKYCDDDIQVFFFKKKKIV